MRSKESAHKYASLFYCTAAYVTYHFYIVHPYPNCTHPTPLSHNPPPPCLTTPHLDSGFRRIPRGLMPLNRPIHIPSPPCVTCTLHMCEKIPSPPNVIPCFAPFVRKDLKLSAAGRLTHGAQTCYKEAEIVDQAYSLMHPIWAGNKVMPFTLHKAPTLICNS